MEVNQYIETAKLYDLDPRNIVLDDISFYMDFAQKAGQEILEVACGTGRVSIPLARAGFNVTGFDLSHEMIQVLENKLMKEELDTRNRLNIFVADMTKYKGDKKYSLILIPFRAFQLLTEDHQQQQFLQRVKDLLADEGVFIINTFKPYGVLDQSWVQDEKEDWTQFDPATKRTVRRTHIRRKIDTDNQITYPELIYYVNETDGTTIMHIEKLAMKYYYEHQLRDLLESNGFSIDEQYGYYDYRAIEEGPELIFVCSLRNLK